MTANLRRRVFEWLRRVPVEDEIERRHAPVLQLLFLFIGLTLPPNWFYHLMLVGSPIRPGRGVDIANDVLITLMAWICFAMIRRGRLRQAVQLFVGAMLLALLAGYLASGMTRQLLDQTYPVLTVVLGGLVLGRRALWTIFVLLLAIFTAGGIVDVVDLTARSYPRPWLGMANVPSITMSYFAITMVIDRCVAALRNSLAESRRMSQALATANASLHREMIERERVQEGLIHAQKMEAIGRLAGGVAHDFNNILGVIVGYAEREKTTTEVGALRKALLGVSAAARRGTAVSRKLLSFSRRDVTRAEVFDASAAMRELAPMLRQLFGAAVRIDIDYAAVPLPVCFDRGQFELMMLNIAANARDAMPVNGHFETQMQAAGDMVEIVLRDNGHGMSEQVCARIFEPFYTTKSADSGTGLGLAVVRELLEASGGNVAVQSAPGQGTTFRIRLPLSRAEATPPEYAGPVCVLLVEDDDDLRELLLAALDDGGCVALGAGNAEDALRLAGQAADSLQVLVSDYRMPDVDGADLLRRLHARLPHVPIILISAYTGVDAAELQQIGADIERLPKPFAPSALLQRVRAAAYRTQRVST